VDTFLDNDVPHSYDVNEIRSHQIATDVSKILWGQEVLKKVTPVPATSFPVYLTLSLSARNNYYYINIKHESLKLDLRTLI
jgi:hypothetical protein